MIMSVELIWQLDVGQVVGDRLQGGKMTWCDIRTMAREGGNVGAGKSIKYWTPGVRKILLGDK